jgi:hypothetical protein
MPDLVINDCTCFKTGVCACEKGNCLCECGCNDCDEIMMNNIEMSMSGCTCGGSCDCSEDEDALA